MKLRVKKIIKKNKRLYSILSGIKNFRSVKREKLYEKIFSNVIEGLVFVSFKNIPGEFEIDVRSDILKRALLKKEYEPEIVNLIHKNVDKNLDAINVGANIGLYANLLANYLGPDQKVLAIEPTHHAYNLLIRNAERNNNTGKIVPFNGLASSKKGYFNLNVIQGKEEYASVGNLVHSSIEGHEAISVKVKGETLDDLVDKYKIKPGIIVIDAEGAEFEVLNGSKSIIKKFRPIIISEVDDFLLEEQKSSSKEIIEFLKGLNYKVMNVENEFIDFPFSGNIMAKPND